MESETFIIELPGWTQLLPPNEIFGSAPNSAEASSDKQDRPLEVDLGCGKGRFILARAKANHDTNFLGIDRLLRRLKKVNRKISREDLSNVRLLRVEASYAVEYLLPPISVSTFYIFFPDPWPKRRHARRRLFTKSFLDSLHRILRPAGCIHLATDHMDYFTEICGLFGQDHRFTAVPAFLPSEEERTDFELVFLKKEAQINRCSFQKTEVGDPAVGGINQKLAPPQAGAEGS